MTKNNMLTPKPIQRSLLVNDFIFHIFHKNQPPTIAERPVNTEQKRIATKSPE
jgi:hypothetical protein